jgi:hypothetical protein
MAAPRDKVSYELNKYGKWRVYKWGTRPDADVRTDDDKEAWLLDSEHDDEDSAKKRASALRNQMKG